MSVLIVQHEPDVSPGRLAGLLPGAQVLRMWEDPAALRPVLASIAEGGADARPEGIVVLGGRKSAYSREEWPWLGDVEELMRLAIARGVRLLGICLGAQLLAVANGGEVEVGAPAGPEYGVTPLSWSPAALEDPLGAALSRFGVVFEDHGDAVSRVPEGARVWARSAKYPQVIRLGCALGVQFHPEVDRGLAASWNAANPDTDTQRVLADFDAHEEALAAACALLAAWVATGETGR